MKTIIGLSSISILIWINCLPVCAQDATPDGLTLPARPYVGTLKGDFTLVAKILHKPRPITPAPTDVQTNGVNAPPPGPDLVEFDSAQSGVIRRDKQIFVDGTTTETWRWNALRFILPPGNTGGIIVASKILSDYDDPTDFDELKWVGPKFYKGEQVFNGKNCYYYKQENQTAYIDESTHWPLLYDSPLMHITYVYGTPEVPLQLPANIAQKLQQMKRAWAGLPPN